MVRNQLPAQVVNLLRWNDVPRTLRIFCPKIAIIFLVLNISKYNQIHSKTSNKFVTSQQFLSNDITPTSSKRKRPIIVYGSVTRYGPRISCQRKSRSTRELCLRNVDRVTSSSRFTGARNIVDHEHHRFRGPRRCGTRAAVDSYRRLRISTGGCGVVNWRGRSASFVRQRASGRKNRRREKGDEEKGENKNWTHALFALALFRYYYRRWSSFVPVPEGGGGGEVLARL